MKRVSTIIVAAGEGKRFGSPKQFSLLGGKPVLEWTLQRFESHRSVNEILLVLPDGENKERYFKLSRKLTAVIKGGEKRQDSVRRGFERIDPKKTDIVLVHDGVRPLVGEDLISRVIEATLKKGAVVPALPMNETLKQVSGPQIIHTVERADLYRVQTPQGFYYSLLKQALEKAAEEGFYGTDEAMLVERLGEKVFLVEGDRRNIKITDPLDLKIAEAFFEI